MSPKSKSVAFPVDGVQCSVDLKSRVVTVGSGLVGNDERDRFKLAVGMALETRELLMAQVSELARKRPKFAALAARAALADATPSGPSLASHICHCLATLALPVAQVARVLRRAPTGWHC